jgi:L-lactate dehydrogenase complex protein LldF
VKIDLAHHLLQNRRNASAEKPSFLWRTGFKLFSFVFNRPALYKLIAPLGRIGQKLHPLVAGTIFDPAYSWTKTRNAPKIAPQTFKEYWKGRN